MSDYSISSAASGKVAPTKAPVAAGGNAKQKKKDANVTPQPAGDPQVSRVEKVEYRDQDGNLLNEAQVKELAGKVSFQTRYETKTRVIDSEGNEIHEEAAGADGHAPPHPDVDRLPETAVDQPDDDGREKPATASPEHDIGKEKSVEKADDGKPRPASEPQEATK